MTNTLPHGCNADANFSFTKLLVDNLEKSAEFYRSVCGLVEQRYHDSTINHHQITSITFLPTYPGGSSLTLLKFLGTLRPTRGEVVLGFTTSNLEGFIERVTAAGGRVADPIKTVRDLRQRVAFVEDMDGHLIEVVQPLD